jgi:4-hydroxybenzoyl-CoA reductase subunit beta
VLRLHEYRYHRPRTVEEALALLRAPDALPIAGGTDLMPNMKHGLFTPAQLVALKGIEALHGVHLVDGAGQRVEREEGAAALSIGAAETLADVARHPLVRRHLPSLAEAASLVAGPQIRNQGTLGGNLCLDTRCTYYNQSRFWREALGYCLKKDGDVCHVTRTGRKCVAAHSADTPPVLITLGAEVELASEDGARSVPVSEFFVADGSWNTVRRAGEIATRVRVPLPARGLRTAYRKVRQRNSIDFPLLSVALAARTDGGGVVEAMSLVVSALGSRPRVVSGLERVAVGRPLRETPEAVAELAHRQCHPLENLTVDPEWRHAMVTVQVRRALEAMAAG